MYVHDDWPKCKSVIDDNKDNFPNVCVVNGQCYGKFQLTAYTYYDPKDFNPVSTITTINAEEQDDKFPSHSMHY